MTWNLSDKNNYLTGMLVLICKDRNIDSTDKKMIRLMADDLGFNHYFVDQSIDEIKERKFIIEEPPEFSSLEIAEAFIRDAIRFAFIDHALHLYELEWLSSIAAKNKLSVQWFFLEIEYFLKNNNYDKDRIYEIKKYVEPVFH
ncbi:MAG: hypothetical protein ACYC49_05610 [Ignavibacteriaceae bacterium]